LRVQQIGTRSVASPPPPPLYPPPYRECSLQRVAEVLGYLVHADATHSSNCESPDEGVRILRVLHKVSHVSSTLESKP
jgi:hypothetical protein